MKRREEKRREEKRREEKRREEKDKKNGKRKAWNNTVCCHLVSHDNTNEAQN
jgi:hypothetical protein